MESIKRSLMLLRPFGVRTENGNIGGTLKLQAAGGELALSLKAEALGAGDYFLYLFLTNGRELYAGDITDGILNTSFPGVPLENISGAAVVHREGLNFSFVLRSTGPDWPTLITRFKMARTQEHFTAKAADTAPRIEPVRIEPVYIEPIHVEPVIESCRKPEPEPVYIECAAESVKPESGISIDNIENIADIVKEGFEEQEANNNIPGIEETDSDACPHALRETKVNPFPSVFPNSEWVKISYPGPAGWWHYISGKIYKGGVMTAKALGVPGEYGMAPPIWLEGFGTYLRCVTGDARGYWLMFQDAETGEVLDMGLSPHGA